MARQIRLQIRTATDIATIDSTWLPYVSYNLHICAGALAKKTLLSFDEWLRFVKDCRLIDAEFTVRLATMCFAWSRMRVVDESLPGARARMLHLTFEVQLL